MNSSYHIKRDIVEVGKLMYAKGFITATDGNISVRISENEIIITPQGKCKGMLDVEDMVVIDLTGKKISGKYNPSGEYRLHLTAYHNREDVKSCVHAHPVYCSSFSVAGIPLVSCVLPEVIISLGAVPLTKYATIYTEEVPQSLMEYIKDYNAILLKNHGVVTFGSDIWEAYFRLEKVEQLAHIIYTARMLGRVDVLSAEQLRKLLKVKEELGIKGRIPECETCDSPCMLVNKK